MGVGRMFIRFRGLWRGGHQLAEFLEEGDLPVRAQRLVKEWAGLYRRELLDMWNRQEFRQLPGLE